MKNLKTSLGVALLAAAALPAFAVNPATSGAVAVPANRIVGLWSTQGSVSPCGSNLPPSTVRNTLLFNAGGTLVENPLGPATGDGVNIRSIGLGKWSFNPTTGQYSMHLRFDRFVDGAYAGYSTVDRVILLSNDGQRATGPVRAAFHAPDDSTFLELCGSAVGTRL